MALFIQINKGWRHAIALRENLLSNLVFPKLLIPGRQVSFGLFSGLDSEVDFSLAFGMMGLCFLNPLLLQGVGCLVAQLIPPLGVPPPPPPVSHLVRAQGLDFFLWTMGEAYGIIPQLYSFKSDESGYPGATSFLS